MPTFSKLFGYWGKAKPDDASSAAPPWHPLVFHSLDVAAVAQVALSKHKHWLNWFSAQLGLAPSETQQLLVWLLGLHDLGKFADNFQSKVPEVYQAQFPGRELVLAGERHDAVGYWLWQVSFRNQGLPESHKDLEPLIAAVCGHHGLPPTEANATELHHCARPASRADALAYVAAWTALIFPNGLPVPPSIKSSRTWWLAGFAVLCDWLGSNTKWFPYCAPNCSLEDYWQNALIKAELAIQESQVAGSATAAFGGAAAVGLSADLLRPMQEAALSLILISGPKLILIEDSTGSGKTEAALLIAHQVMAQNEASGLYFGLPTQATANSVFQRMQKIAPQLVADAAKSSMVLSHGASHMQKNFRALVNNDWVDALPGELDTASMGLSTWLAESNKRALLAQIGVGTIDQSLLSVLRSKHSALRLFALVGKVLIIDEVHAYDAYLIGVLKDVLRAHASAGGIAILLSATLAAKTRLELMDSYRQVLFPPIVKRGVATPGKTIPEVLSAEYPLLSVLSCDGLTQLPVRPTAQAFRRVSVRYLTEPLQVLACLLSAARAGQCAAWIRNTVAEAQASFAELRTLCAGDAGVCVTLFHSRFAAVDRQRIESDVLARFGPDSTHTTRRGHIVIATQVIEQSLDLDFDLLVTDIAPIDLLLQRLGRLRRHARDAMGNRTSGSDQRGELALHVHGPDRDAEPERDWLRRFSRGSAMVYPHHGQIFASAKALGTVMDLPSQQRALIEAVYGDGACYPPALQQASDSAEGSAIGSGMQAGHNTVNIALGYLRTNSDWPDDFRAPTRLGDPTVEVALACALNGVIVPWAQGEDDYERWSLSIVRMRAEQLNARAPLANAALEVLAKKMQQESPFLRWRVLLVLVPSELGWIGTAKAKNRALTDFAYHAEIGLQRSRLLSI